MMKKIILFIFGIALLTGCEKEDVGENFDTRRTNQVLMQFLAEDEFNSLPVAPNENLTREIEVGVTNARDFDRTVNVQVDQANTSLDASLYDLSEIVIPADSFVGRGTLTTIAEDPFSGPSRLELNLLGIEDTDSEEIIEGIDRLVFTTFQFCPFDPGVTFTGDYQLSYPDGGSLGGPPNNSPRPFDSFDANGNNLGEPIVNLTEGGTPAERNIELPFYDNLTSANVTLSLQFICGQIEFDEVGIPGCGGVAINIEPLGNSTYDPSDDSSFQVEIFENTNGSCGASAQPITLTFTKI